MTYDADARRIVTMRRSAGRRAAALARIKTRFLEQIEKIPFHDCWEWAGDVGDHGYGRLAAGASGAKILAHRFSWEFHEAKPIPPGLFVCHHCDNRSCVRPDHLFLGTVADNNADMHRKGRYGKGPRPNMRRCSHERHGRAYCAECRSVSAHERYQRKKTTVTVDQQSVTLNLRAQ